MGIWFVAPDALVLAWGKTFLIPDPPASAQGGKTLADGYPPLTANFIDAFASAMNRILGVPANAQTKAKLQRNLLAAWQSEDGNSMSNAVRFLAYDKEISQQGENELLVRQFVRAEILKQASKPQANLLMRQLKDFYTDAHPVLAEGYPGAPPLTADMQQAYVSLMAFVLKEIPNGVGELRETERKWLADSFVEMYRQADAEAQRDMSELPVAWIALQKEWATVSDVKRSQTRQSLAQKFSDTAREIKSVRAQDDANDAATAEFKRAADELDRKLTDRTAKPEDFERVAQVADRTFQLFQTAHPAIAKTYSAYAGQLRRQAADLRQTPTSAAAARDSSIQMYDNIVKQHEKNVAQAMAEADRLAKQNPSSGTYNPGPGFWSGIRAITVANLNVGTIGTGYVWR
jgi:hypothetical protein